MTTIEALKIIGPLDDTIEALKKAYHEKALQYHPDRQGGNEEYMKLVNLAYETLLKIVGSYSASEAKASEETPLTEQLAAIYGRIKHFQGITIEVAGTWFWITGNTYTYRTELKNMGFKWANKKKAWYYHEGQYQKETRRSWDLDEIRNKFSSFTLGSEKNMSLGNA
jgi:hypothetical protein